MIDASPRDTCRGPRTWNANGTGQTLIQIGRLDEARPLLDDAVRHVTPEGAPRFRAIALEALGQLHRARDQLEEAAPLIVEAQTLRQALAASAR